VDSVLAELPGNPTMAVLILIFAATPRAWCESPPHAIPA